MMKNDNDTNQILVNLYTKAIKERYVMVERPVFPKMCMIYYCETSLS